jgi:hypothetical protein
MKNYILIVLASLFFTSCSTEDFDNEVDAKSKGLSFENDNLDIVSFTPKKAYDNSNRGKYVGVFGNTENRDLHGKIFINAGNYTRYIALIQLVNGKELEFIGKRIDETSVFFKGKRGTFVFISKDYLNPMVENITIDAAIGSYIILKKSFNRAPPLVLIGTYEETGNEENFYGNWDVIGDGSQPQVQFVSQVIITHLGSSEPIIDDTMEATSLTGCTHGDMPRMFDPNGNGGVTLIGSDNQTSLLAGHISTWSLMWQNYNYHDELCNNLGPDAGGSWSWNGRTGKIFVMRW